MSENGQRSRREVLALGAGLGMASMAADSGRKDWTLIAHRGAVSAKAPENTAQAIEAAIRDGYWMAEVDLRKSADGEIVLNHDADFERIYGFKKNIGECSWAEIRKLRSGQARPMLFAEAAQMVKGHIGLWLDIKEKPASSDFLTKVEQILRENRVLDRTWVGIHPQASSWFKGKARIAATVGELFGLYMAGVDLSQDYVLAEGLGFAMSPRTVQWALAKRVPVSPFVGMWHYPGGDAMAAGSRDIQFLMKAGVTTFMIDSIYKPVFDRER